jgi:hypothetical protein
MVEGMPQFLSKPTFGKRHKPDPDGTWLWLAGANLLLCLAFLLFFVIVAWLSVSTAKAWELQSPIRFDEEPIVKPPPPKPPESPHTFTERETAPPPPEVRPYSIPTLTGEKRDYHYIPPIKLSPKIDADAVFRMIVNCIPEQPKWGIEVKAVAGLRYTEQNTISTFDTAGLSRYYGGIVAEMPLYSSDERFRIREVEVKRRSEIAANVAALLKALADRDRALRLVGIAESAEARSQVRVREGIAGAEEQIGYLKEVAGHTSDFVAADAAITAARLALAGQCREEVAETVNDYLVEVTR